VAHSPEQQRAYRLASKEQIAEKKRAYREANRGEIAEKQRAYAQANKEKIAEKDRAYRLASKEQIAEKKRAYAQANKEKIAEKQRAYAQANKEKIAEKDRAYSLANPNMRRKHCATRRARKLNQFVEDVDPQTCYAMHGGMCGICKEFIEGDFHVDHIKPLSKGGLHGYFNCQPAHPVCNLRKGTSYDG